MDKTPSRPCALALAPEGDAGAGSSLPCPGPHSQGDSQGTAQPWKEQPAYHLSPHWRRHDIHVLVGDKHLLDSHPLRSRAQKLPGIWAYSQGPPTDGLATDTRPPFLPLLSHRLSFCPKLQIGLMVLTLFPTSLFSISLPRPYCLLCLPCCLAHPFFSLCQCALFPKTPLPPPLPSLA
jgi:hypothetical protein